MSLILGAVADDFTGATDLAGMLGATGMRTMLVLGVPEAEAAAPDAEAVVVALKTRTIPAAEAVAQSLAAWRWLERSGARQACFKYCSTFDSTDKGNIGPVAEALWRETGEGPTVFVPSLPENGRTVYRGHLFVFDQLLSDSGMRNHPLTAMTDANLVRVLSRQISVGVGLIRSGNISVRLDDGLLITPTSTSLGRLDPARLAKLAPDGTPVSGDKPSKEGFLHLAVYARRPEMRAVVHLHSTCSVALSTLAALEPENMLPPQMR